MKPLTKDIYRVVLRKFLGVLLLFLINSSLVMAIENFPDSHNQDHHGTVELLENRDNSFEVYACNIIGYSSQCREYEILDGAKTTLAEIKTGCESMKGEFSNKACPKDKVLALCTDIIRNYHQPDVIYANHYYQGKTSIWSIPLIKEVCGDLGGEVLIEKSE